MAVAVLAGPVTMAMRLCPRAIKWLTRARAPESESPLTLSTSQPVIWRSITTVGVSWLRSLARSSASEPYGAIITPSTRWLTTTSR